MGRVSLLRVSVVSVTCSLNISWQLVRLVCTKWVGARCWCAGLLLASVVSGRASLLPSVVSVRALLLLVSGGGGGGEKVDRRSQEARPTRCRVQPACSAS